MINPFRIFGDSLRSVETPLTSQRNPRGRIPQKCCGDCWGYCRGKPGQLRGVLGELPRECWGSAGRTALCTIRKRDPALPPAVPRQFPPPPPAPRFSRRSPQQFWGIQPLGFLWLVSRVSRILLILVAFCWEFQYEPFVRQYTCSFLSSVFAIPPIHLLLIKLFRRLDLLEISVYS